VIGAAQPRDCHRRFTLAVELHEDRTERRYRFLQAVDVHRAPAVDHRSQIVRAGSSGLNQARNHGGRQEGTATGMVVAEIEELLRLERTGFGYHLPSTAQHVRGNVEARSVRHRRAVDQAAFLVRRIEIRKVGNGHRHQVAVRQHRAL